MKLIGIDMDGTLLNDDNEVTQNQLEFFKNNQLGEDIKFAIVTGRPLLGVLNLLPKEIWNKFYKICLNGSIIFDYENTVLYKNIIPSEKYITLINFLKQKNIDFLVLDSQNFYGEKINDLMLYDAGLNKMEINEIPFEALTDLKDITKVLLFINPEDRGRVFNDIPYELRNSFSLILSQDYLIEFLNQGADKGSAFSYLSSHLSQGQDIVTYAIGDGLNDIQFMENSGIKIAMKNAESEILSLSDYITADNNNDGVIKAIKEIILG